MYVLSFDGFLAATLNILFSLCFQPFVHFFNIAVDFSYPSAGEIDFSATSSISGNLVSLILQ